jgi:hypothetical protein
MFNIDETMVDVITKPKSVVIFKDEPCPTTTEPGKMEHITLLLTLPIKGDPIKPLVIFPLQTLPALHNDIMSYYDITGSSKGWINGPILKLWLENQFLSQIYQRRQKYGSNQPALVILDNHSSRDIIDTETLWNEHKIMFLFIPPHTSHVVQPLDLCPNVMYKRLLTKRYKPRKSDSTNARRNLIMMASISSLQTALSPAYCESAWEKSGLYPFNPEIVLEGGLVPKTINDEIPAEPAKKKRKPVKFAGGIVSNGEKVVIQIVYVNRDNEAQNIV